MVASIKFYMTRQGWLQSPKFLVRLSLISGVMMMLIGSNLIQTALWALLFYFLDEFANFNEAFYHSAVNFATLGYGDFVMSQKNKLLGALEALNGIVMVGVSTSVLMWVLQDTLKIMLSKAHR
ncbi:hypothetical protein AAOGI_32580 [Agarivorans albus]